jgi:multiple sugar transport system permease protein
MRTSRRYTAVALTPSMLLFAVVLIFPTAYVLNLMFQRYSLTDVTSNRYIGIDNFTRLAGENRFLDAALHSIAFSAVSMAVSIPVGIAIALLIRKRLRGTSVLRAVLIVPMVLAPLVVGAVFRFMLESGGFVDWLLRSVRTSEDREHATGPIR